MHEQHQLYFKLTIASPSTYLENLIRTLRCCMLIYAAEFLTSDIGCNITSCAMTLLRDDFQSPKEYLLCCNIYF